MRKPLCLILVAGLVWVGAAGMAQAGRVTFTFAGLVMAGPLEGSVGTGSFSYNKNLIINGDEVLGTGDGLTIIFSFAGQDFDQTHDMDFDTFPELVFIDGMPVYLDYSLYDGQMGVNFNDPNLLEISFGERLSGGGDFDYEFELYTKTVPIPGAIWMLGAGIVYLLGQGRKNSRKA